MQYFNGRGNTTKFQAGKNLHHVQVQNILNFQFMNF